MNRLNLRLRPISGTGWLKQNDSEQIVSRRPLSLRVSSGALAVCLTWLAVTTFPNLSPLLFDRAAATAAVTIALMLVSLSICLLLGTGPNRLCLDLRHWQCSLTRGSA